jgi:hypothetical protein
VVITFRASRNENSIFDSLYVKVLFTPKSHPFLESNADGSPVLNYRFAECYQ